MARISYFLTLIFGIVLLVAAGWTYRELLWSTFGSFDKSGTPVVQAFDSGGQIALLVSGYTQEANRARGDRGVDPAWMGATLDNWRAFLRSSGATVHEISDADVESGRLDAYDLLVLPSTTALSDRQIAQIKDYMYGGRSVMASWTPGIYRPDGSWRGWSFVEEAFGVETTGFIEHSFANFRVYTDTFPGIARPGLYRPEMRSVESLIEGEAEVMREGTFSPLSGYTWTAPLQAERPADHFALADTLVRHRSVDGQVRREVATRVQFFTWLGGDPTAAAEAASSEAAFGRVTFKAGTPLAAGIPAPFRMKTGTFDAPLQMRPAEPRTKGAAFWHDFAASDRAAPGAVAASAAIVYGTYGRGRYIYMGHELSAMGFDPVEQSVLARFFENSLRWLGRAPVVWVEAWPFDYKRAALVAGIATDATRLDAMVAPFREFNAPATLFVTADNAERHSQLMARLTGRAELGLLADASVSDLAMGSLRDRFERATGVAPAGLRATGRESLSRDIVRGISNAGFKYTFPDTLGRSMRPDVLVDPELVNITRTARTDRHILSVTPAGSAEMRLDYIMDDIGRVETEGGLYTLLIHDDGFGLPEHLPLVGQTLRLLRDRGFWLASGTELADWSIAREGLGVHVESRGPRRVHVRISNNGTQVATNLALAIDLGQSVSRVNVRPELVGTPDPVIRLENGNNMLTLIVDELAPRAYRIYQIDLVPQEVYTHADSRPVPFWLRR
jgi:peptidoglycan/xylan/chitin deacetylase (PgdA/CDA1 family)